jgi:surface polysaccharide O-acyltransferase-like enzyme
MFVYIDKLTGKKSLKADASKNDLLSSVPAHTLLTETGRQQHAVYNYCGVLLTLSLMVVAVSFVRLKLPLRTVRNLNCRVRPQY